MPSRPRIAICGVHIESSTFSPHVSTVADFQVREGADLLERYDLPASGLADAAEFHGIFHARALPGGAVEGAAYDYFKHKIVEGLRAVGPIDGVLFDIHGAMSVIGMDDAEGDLITAVREVVGPDVLVSAPMDLHGNVSQTLFRGCDLLTCYRTAPHVDVLETRQRALRHLIECVNGGIRPQRALVHVPILLPGEMTSTRMEPAQSLYAQIDALVSVPGIMDASIWIGFAWADEPRCQAAIVVTGTDTDAIEREALRLASGVWAARHDFSFVAPTGPFDQCLRTALESEARPFFLSDSGDNPGAGGADDCTWTLAALLNEPRLTSGELRAVLASIVDPHTVKRAREIGVGATAEFTVGAVIDTREPGPQTFEALVAEFRPDGDAVRLVRGGLEVIVTQRREQFSQEWQYKEVGISLADADIVVVKMGYLEPDLFEAQRGWFLALTPGGVDQDLRRLGHHRIARPMIPFDEEIPRPVALTDCSWENATTTQPVLHTALS